MANIVKRIKEELTFENVLSVAIKTPGVHIDRADFLRRELHLFFPDSVVEEAVRYNPAKAGIPRHIISGIAESVISYEAGKATGLSIVASLSSSANAAFTIPAVSADITSYFVFVLRVVQKLAYLYGFEEFDTFEDGLDSESMSIVMVFIGAMFGVQRATSALGKLAESMAIHIQKKLANKALTKGVVYPIVKNIAKAVGVRMTKQIFADAVATSIPIAGSLLSGGVTYFSFKPSCARLKKHLMKFPLSDPDFYSQE